MVFGPIFILGLFMLAVGLMAVGLKLAAALLPGHWLAFASPTAERLRARFDDGMRFSASLVTEIIPVLLAGYLLVTTAVSVGSLFVLDLRETWRASGMGVWFVAAIVATSLVGPFALLRSLGRHPSGRWLAFAVASNWGLYNMWRSVEAVTSAAPPDRLIGSLIFGAFGAFGLVLAAVARSSGSGSPK